MLSTIKLYDMKYGDITKFGYWEVTRVPGGWIFLSGNGDSQSAAFVPFNNEFMQPTEH